MTWQMNAKIEVTDVGPDQIDALADRLMDALLDLEGVEDPIVSGSVAKGLIEISFTLPTDQVDSGKALPLLESALRKAGLRTDLPVSGPGPVPAIAAMQTELVSA